ncbi:MAG: exodeoxyribonuclease VII small subunit [Oscillochloris sp.]|nr:exodeoxyribonuclease VII small subunit [Oscillochloris sp.]
MASTTDTTPVARYEQLFARLQTVVEQLEAGELALDEALKLYEEGTQLASACQHLLDEAELRVQQLQAGDKPIDLEG